MLRVIDLHIVEQMLWLNHKYFDWTMNAYDCIVVFLWGRVEHATASSWRSRAHEEGDGETHQESLIEGGANVPRGDIRGARGALPATVGNVEFM